MNRLPAEGALNPASEAGFTIIEVVVVATLSLIVFSATAYALTQGMSVATQREDRVMQLEMTQTAEQRLVRELRQASSLTFTSSSSLTYSVPGVGVVRFSCSGTTCTRTVSGVSTTAITNLASTNVFSASPNTTSPTYIGITLTISYPNHTNTTLADGADLRNVTLGK